MVSFSGVFEVVHSCQVVVSALGVVLTSVVQLDHSLVVVSALGVVFTSVVQLDHSLVVVSALGVVLDSVVQLDHPAEEVSPAITDEAKTANAATEYFMLIGYKLS